MRILVPVDGSPTSMKGLEKAVELAKLYSAEIILTNVQHEHNLDERYRRPTAPLIFIESEKLEEMGRALLADMLAKVNIEGVKYSEKIMFGDPGHAIIDCAEQEDVDLIIIGSKGLTGIKKFLLGSVASKVLTYAHCDVMIIK